MNKFNLLLETISLDDKIRHLFAIDIEFDYENADAVIDKQKTLDGNERSVFQLCELYAEASEREPKSHRTTKRSQVALIPKKFIPLYLERLKFLILRCGWKVIKLYSHFTFEMSIFKREFILMNQKSRQTT